MDRRLLLRSLPSFLAASSIPSVWSPAWAAAKQFPVALLIPKSGSNAALGRSMERAAAMVQGVNDRGALLVFDTAGTPDGAATAARAARKAGATIILGPVFSREVPAVVAAVGGSVPIVTFSNDAALLESGAFLFGITAAQPVTSVLAYAASRGIRRIAVGGADDGWGASVRSAAMAVAASLGIDAYQLPTGDLSAIPATATGSTDGLPDAVLMPSPSGLARLVPGVAGQGIQLLGAFQGIDVSLDQLRTLDGAWLAAPDPARFAGFATAYEARNGSRPGLIAGLAYDAATIAQQMRLGGGTDRSALLSASGFKAVCGDVRFRENGSATRNLAILAVSSGGLRTVAATPAG